MMTLSGIGKVSSRTGTHAKAEDWLGKGFKTVLRRIETGQLSLSYLVQSIER
jgi:hypothetical protein